MAIIKFLRGNHTSLDTTQKQDGYVYFCMDDGSIYIDYTDSNGVVQRKQLNAKDAETLGGYDLTAISDYATKELIEDLKPEICYYSTLSNAITDIESNTTENSITNDITEACVKVFTSYNGVKKIVLLKDLIETSQIKITKNLDINLGGHTLTFESSAAYMQIDSKIAHISDGNIVADITGGTPYQFLIGVRGDYLAMNNVNLNVYGGKSSPICGTYILNEDGIYEIKNCNFVVKNTIHQAIGICLNKGLLNVENTTISTDASNPISTTQAYGILNYDRLNIANSTIFADAPDNSVDRNGYSIGILNEGTLYANNTNVSGTHSGIETLGNMYIRGGVYTSCSHGGLYISTNGAGETFVNDATILCGDYTGVHDSTLFSNAKLAALYFGASGEDSNGEVAYFDGCIIDATGANHVIALRDSHGADINVFNISNSTISDGNNYIRMDGPTVKLNIGEGTNITTDRLGSTSNYEYTNELYRKFGNDTDILGKDFNPTFKVCATKNELSKEKAKLIGGADDLADADTIHAAKNLARGLVNGLESKVVKTTELNNAINSALSQAKASGVFDGADGLSSYEIWLSQGNTGSEADFLESLKGDDGAGASLVFRYATLSDAIAAVESESFENEIANNEEAFVEVFSSGGMKTVVLLKDLLETSQINITKNVNIDLNGKTLSFEHSAAYIQASCKKLKISNGSIFVDISGGIPSAGLFRCTSDCLIMDNVSISVIGGISSQFIGLFLQNTNGVYDLKNCNIDVKNNLNAAVAIYHYKGILNIENTSIKVDTDSAKQTYGLLNSDRANIIDSTIFADAPDNAVDRNGCASGILNYNILYATNVTVIGTHSGLSTYGSAYIYGGIYDSCSHGGMYITNNGNGETFVKDATIRCGDYTGVHDSTLFSNVKLAALYFGDSGDSSNGEVAYFDGCTIEAVGANHVMALRDSHGDNINVFNISNSTISEGTNYIRTDGQTVKVNIGEGTNITTNRLYVDANYEYTNKLYRRFGNDTDIKGKDLTAVNSFLESEREALLDKNNIKHELGNDERSIISQKAITEILEQYEEDVDSKISEVTETIKQSDWSQNDSSANDYVRNRTHWTDDDGTVHPLDETYIPDTIARTENVNEQYNQLSELKADKTAISTPYTFKGSTTFSALPTTNNTVNDTYFCTDKNCKYTWSGTGWYQSSLIETQYVDRLNYIDEELSNFISNISEYDEQLFELDKWINGSLYYDSSTTVWNNMSAWRRYPAFDLEAGTYFVANIHASFFNLKFADGTVTNLVKYANWVPFSSNGEATNANGYFVIDQTVTVYASTNKWDKTMLSRKRIPDNVGYVEGVYALQLRPDIVNYSINDIKIENILLGNLETMNPRNCGSFEGYPITFVQTHTGSGNRWWEIGFDASKSKRGFIRVDINISAMSGAAKLYLFGNSTSGSNLIIPVQDIKEAGRHIMDIDLNFYVVYHDLVLDNNVRVGIANHTDEFSCTYDKINVYDLSTDLDTDKNLNDNLSDMMIQIQSNTNNINSLKERSSATILVAPNGEKYIIQVGENGAVTSTPKIPKNILYIGNSLLIGWGTFGMAASNSSSDYYYYVNQYLQDLGVNLTTNKVKGVGFEGCTSSAEQTAWYNDTLLPTLNNDIDLVIIQLGDNVNTAEKLAVFEQGAKDLVTFVRTNAPRARVAWVGEWYSSTAKQTYIANACAERGADFIDISDLPKVSGYCANIGDVVTKDDGTTVTIDSSGVASHPSSKGMKAVADKIINALFK